MGKKFNIINLLLLAYIICVSCDQNILGHEDTPTDTLIVPTNPPRNFSVSGCKSFGTKGTRGLFHDETIEYKARENGLLRIMHNNAVFECSVKQIYAEMLVVGHTYIIEEKSQESSVSTDCICRYDLGYDIGPFKEGEYYSISIRRGKDKESEVTNFSFTYSPTINDQITGE